MRLPLPTLLISAALTAAALAQRSSDEERSVSYDARSFLINGQRELLLSGSIHYQRVLPSDWPRVLALALEAGL